MEMCWTSQTEIHMFFVAASIPLLGLTPGPTLSNFGAVFGIDLEVLGQRIPENIQTVQLTPKQYNKQKKMLLSSIAIADLGDSIFKCFWGTIAASFRNNIEIHVGPDSQMS